MKATIWHNPKCSKSRAALETLQQCSGLELEIVEYLKTPPTRAKLEQLYRDADMHPRNGLRLSGSPAEELGLTAPDVSADDILNAMASDPRLIERPLVETEKGVRLCRPLDKLEEIL